MATFIDLLNQFVVSQVTGVLTRGGFMRWASQREESDVHLEHLVRGRPDARWSEKAH